MRATSVKPPAIARSGCAASRALRSKKDRNARMPPSASPPTTASPSAPATCAYPSTSSGATGSSSHAKPSASSWRPVSIAGRTV